MTSGLEKSEKASRRVFRRYFPLIFILWIVFVLYPNPLNLIISIQRVINFDTDPAAVESILSDLPSDPGDIEKAVLAKIHYGYDWEVYGMPWYCPTVEQVLAHGAGDCKCRALVLASVLEAKNIAYEIHLSPIHVWVSYADKNETSIENAQVEYLQYDPQTGERRFQIPNIAPSKVTNSYVQAFWDPMPDGRKALLISGLVGLVAARVVVRKKKAVRLAGS
jgi:hypothetical protein